MIEKRLSKLNFEVAVITVMLLVNAGHIGSYLATLEMNYLQWLGYVQALTIDAAALICAYRMRRKSQRKVAVAGWAFFCGVSGLLNAMYYVRVGVGVPLAAALGCWAPAAVLLIGWLKSSTDVLDARAAKAAATRARRRRMETETKAEEAKSEPAFVCSFPGCGRSFGSQNGLNAHQRAHSDG